MKSELREKAENTPCPVCHAKAGENCRYKDPVLIHWLCKIPPFHKERYELAKRELALNAQ